MLTLRHHRVSLADALQRLQLYLPLLEDIVHAVRPARLRVSVEQPGETTTTSFLFFLRKYSKIAGIFILYKTI